MIRDELVTTAESAVLLRRNIATVNTWARTGKLRVAHRNPGRTGANLFYRADVIALAAEHEHEHEPA